jgi:signal transduction histidine kinase
MSAAMSGNVRRTPGHAATSTTEDARRSELTATLFGDLKAYVHFDEHDQENLRQLARPLADRLGGVVEELYGKLQEYPAARSAIRESGASPTRVRATIADWMNGILQGPYNAEYFARRSRIGHVHVRLRMPQHFMVAALCLARLALTDEVGRLGIAEPEDKIRSVHKIIDIETAIIMETFRDGYAERVRRAERRALRERLRESEHLANVGQLAATLAHEIKNPLAGISGAIQVLASALPRDDPHLEIVEEILSQIDRMDATVRDLLVYARPKPPERHLHKVGSAVQRTLTLLLREPAFEGVSTRCEGLNCDAEALIDESQFQQVISNLLLNAADACEPGGEVVVRLIGGSGYVQVEVSDNGKGMSPTQVERACEPFFTTKAKGTGLGLSICKRIIDAHDGRMTIHSRQGSGTRVVIELPSDL